MRYYLLREDMDFPDRWYLGDILHVDNWRFSDPTCDFMEPCTYTIQVYRDGHEMDYCTSEVYGAPVVSESVKLALQGIPQVDEPYHHVVMEPVVIEGKKVTKKYFVIIIETQVDCVDEDRSEFEKFTDDDSVRPDLAGNYNGFFNLVVDPAKAVGHHIFRIKGHLGSIIVSEDIKKRLEDAKVSGVIFESSKWRSKDSSIEAPYARTTDLQCTKHSSESFTW